MSTYTNALIHVWLKNQTFNTRGDVEDYIEEQESYLENAKKTLYKLAWMTEPKKFCEDDENPEIYIENNLRYAIDEIENVSVNIFIANKILDSWDYTHNSDGLAIGDKGQSFDKQQRISGDFIKTVDENGNEIFDL